MAKTEPLERPAKTEQLAPTAQTAPTAKTEPPELKAKKEPLA
jgi:hypothetical protein